MATPSRTRLRRDAARNRERLLAAARELLATRGPGVSLNDIAHHAGVGVGTAYRRFPNKDAVVDALFEEALDDMAHLARESLAASSAWDGLASFLERSLDLQFGDRGLGVLMNDPALGDERAAEARTRIAPLLEQLVDRARREGCVRPDLHQSDLIFLQVALSAILHRSAGVAPQLYRRYLEMFLDGVRPTASTPLPVPALDSAQTHRAMTEPRRTHPRKAPA